MTKSTITREQAQKIIVAADEVITALAGNNEDVHPDDSKKMCDLWDDLNDRYAPPEVVRELARMALAAMDSEPVAYIVHSPHGDTAFRTISASDAEYIKRKGYRSEPLYRHAQPVLTPYAWSYDWAHCVTCDGPQDFKPVIEREPPPQWAIDDGRVKNLITLYRQTQPAPVVSEDLYKLANHIASSKNGLPDEWQDWAEELESDIRRAAMLQDEPVTTTNKLGNSPVIPDCWCRTCRPVALNDTRFVVCPDCGNKRCPRANDHRNSCTGSNEPGQEGSAYPADPHATPALDPEKSVVTVSDTWISVSERMPKVGDEILYFCQEDGMKDCGIVSSSNFSGKGDKQLYVYTAWGDLHFGVEITQWMPLPASPQEVKNV